MAVMKIRGGDLDLVEYEFTSFLPGEQIKTLGFEDDYKLVPLNDVVTVNAPARIHLTVLDMNRFSPARPGGGGIGFAIQVYCSVSVECIPEGLEIDYSRASLVRHFTTVFTRTVNYKGGFRIRARDHEHRHVGLGSTSTVMIALAKALNVAVGSPLADDQLRKLIGYNYVEETADGHIAPGFETGVGPAVSIHGGIAITGDELTLVYHHPFANGRNVFIVIPRTEISSAGDKEFDLLMNKARMLDYRDRELKAYLILMDMIPALENDDLKRVGDVMWEIEFRGSKRAEVEHHSFEIYHYMSQLREAGFEFVGMSSVGPAIAVITERSEEDLAAILKPMGLIIAIRTKIDNRGLQVTHIPGR
ncbi:MAG TPA: GHMP kinase [Methanoregulaceae archaeon]|nr:GHMP kinase [Methanoregulaceae archaeon]